MIEETQVIVQKLTSQTFSGDLLDADVLTGEHRAQVELAALEADAANA